MSEEFSMRIWSDAKGFPRITISGTDYNKIDLSVKQAKMLCMLLDTAVNGFEAMEVIVPIEQPDVIHQKADRSLLGG